MTENINAANQSADLDRTGHAGLSPIASGFTTLGFCLLAFLAFDDITTDNATSFTFEYIGLFGCALWALFLAIRLILQGHRILGALSVIMLAAAVWSQRKIGPGTIPGWEPEYVATASGLLWFLLLSILLVLMGSRRRVTS